MTAPVNRPELAPAPTAAPLRDDAARKPRSLADRLRLGLILVLLPAAVVCIPTVAVTYIFGQRPAAKAPHTEALQHSLEQSASNLMPTPAPLAPEPVTVTVRADHLAARMDKVSRQAREFGGSVSEGLSTATEKRLSVELPAGRAEAFRQAVNTNAATAVFSSPAAAGAGKDYVEVVIRTAAEDE